MTLRHSLVRGRMKEGVSRVKTQRHQGNNSPRLTPDNDLFALKKFREKGDACNESFKFHRLGSFAVAVRGADASAKAYLDRRACELPRHRSRTGSLCRSKNRR